MNYLSPIRRRRERGYILLTLMLFVALLTIGLLALVQNIGSQIKRDREEEMIHRGVQYSRAVRRYFKKFGRYPNRIEELENTNNIRFLRKRYKDPITGKDFKPLHITDVQLSFVSGAPVSGAPGGGLPPGGLDASSPGGTNAAPSAAVGPGQDATTSQGPQPGDQSGPKSGDQTGGPVTGTASGQSSGLSVRSGQTQSNDTGPAGAQVFGGQPIVGVASVSKDKTIRVFNKKDHYNQWQFIYDPTSDRGGLLMTPNQPPLKGATDLTPSNGMPGSPSQNPPPGASQQGGPGTPPQQLTPQQPPDQ